MHEDNNQRSFCTLFPSSTSIKDFAYPDSHPLRTGNFEIPYMYNSSSTFPDDKYDFDDYRDSELANEDIRGAYSSDEINRKAMALFDFHPENDNEVALKEGQTIWVSYRHGQGWLVAEDPETGENGLVPEEYVEIFYDNDEIIEDIPKPFLPEILQGYYGSKQENVQSESEWVDTDCEDDDYNDNPIPENQQSKSKESDEEIKALSSRIDDVSIDK